MNALLLSLTSCSNLYTRHSSSCAFSDLSICLNPELPPDLIEPLDQIQVDNNGAVMKLNGVRWLQCIKKHEILIEEAKQCLD